MCAANQLFAARGVVGVDESGQSVSPGELRTPPPSTSGAVGACLAGRTTLEDSSDDRSRRSVDAHGGGGETRPRCCRDDDDHDGRTSKHPSASCAARDRSAASINTNNSARFVSPLTTLRQQHCRGISSSLLLICRVDKLHILFDSVRVFVCRLTDS